MTRAHHDQILHKIVDVPKILSLLQLYGYGSNSEILRLLIKEFIANNPDDFNQDLGLVCRDVTHLLNRYAENDFEISDEHLSQLYNLVANVTDIIFSLNKLIVIEPRLSALFCDCELPEPLIMFYSKYFPFIEKKCDDLFQRNLIVEKYEFNPQIIYCLKF